MEAKPSYEELEQRVKKIEEKVSKLAHVEEELDRKNIELNYFINNIPDMAWVKDADSRFIAVNRAVTSLNPASHLGYSARSVIFKSSSKQKLLFFLVLDDHHHLFAEIMLANKSFNFLNHCRVLV